MNTRKTLSLIGAVAASIALTISAVSAQEAPRIEFEKTDHDFGTLKAAGPVHYVFTYKNTGNAPLVLSDVHASCGCTAAQWLKEPLAPGESASISISLSPPNPAAPRSSSITVKSNDPEKPQVVLSVRAKFTSDVNWEPNAYVYFGNVVGTAEVTKTTDVWFDKPARVLEVQSNSDKFKATFEEVEPQKRYRIKITTVPPLPLGGYGGIISVRTDLEGHERIQCTANVNIVPLISSYPNEAAFTWQGDNLTGPFLAVRHNDGGKFKVSKVTTDIPGLAVKAQPLGDGGSYRIILEKASNEAVKATHGQVNVFTDNKEVPVVHVKVYLSLPPPAQ